MTNGGVARRYAAASCFCAVVRTAPPPPFISILSVHSFKAFQRNLGGKSGGDVGETKATFCFTWKRESEREKEREEEEESEVGKGEEEEEGTKA